MADYQKWRLAHLRKELRRRGLDDGGDRQALASRLAEEDAQGQGAERDEDEDGRLEDDTAHEQGSARDADEALQDDAAQEQETGRAGHGKAEETQRLHGDGAPNARELVERIRTEFEEVLGLEVERVNGLTEAERGWLAQVDVVEMSRTPPSTDVLATYEVMTDEDAALASFERIRRFRRSDTEGGTR